MVVTFAVNCVTFFYIVDDRVAKYKLIAPLFYGKIGKFVCFHITLCNRLLKYQNFVEALVKYTYFVF